MKTYDDLKQLHYAPDALECFMSSCNVLEIIAKRIKPLGTNAFNKGEEIVFHLPYRNNYED